MGEMSLGAIRTDTADRCVRFIGHLMPWEADVTVNQETDWLGWDGWVSVEIGP